MPQHKAATRILYIDHTATLGGGEIALLNLVRHLNTRRFHPIVVLSSDGKLRNQLEAAGIETHVLPLSGAVVHTRKDALGIPSLLKVGAIAQSGAYVRRLARFIREFEIDLVHTNSLKADLLGGFAARMARVPVVWHIRDRIASDYLPAPVARLFRWMCTWVPNYVIANSQSTLDTLKLPRAVQSIAVPSGVVIERTRVVHDGVDPSANGFDRTQHCGPTTVGIVGRISPWKGQHIFVEAAAAVRDKLPDTKFQIVGAAMFGEHKYEQGLREQVTSLGLSDCLQFTGFCTDVPARLKSFTVLVHASVTAEPFGQVVLEGMAAGKPVIATRGGGVVEIVEDGVTGILVPMNDASALGSAMIELLENPDTARRMGRAGYCRVAEHFRIDATVHRVEQVYEEVLSRSKSVMRKRRRIQ